MSLLRSLIRIYLLWTLCCSRLSLTNMDGHLEVVSKLFELMQLWKWAQSCCNKFLENFKYKIQLTVPYTCFFRTELISLTLFELSDVRPHRLRFKVETSIMLLRNLDSSKAVQWNSIGQTASLICHWDNNSNRGRQKEDVFISRDTIIILTDIDTQ